MNRIFLVVTLLALMFVPASASQFATASFEDEGPPSYCILKVGTNNNDSIPGTSSCDDVRAQDGNDFVRGYGDGDWLYGEKGSDTLEGGSNGDVLIAGCQGGVCNPGLYNTLRGGKGHDRLAARNDSGTDYMNGGDGWDICIGNQFDTFVNCEDIQN